MMLQYCALRHLIIVGDTIGEYMEMELHGSSAIPLLQNCWRGRVPRRRSMTMPEIKREQPEAREAVRLTAASPRSRTTPVLPQRRPRKPQLKSKKRRPTRRATWSTVPRIKAESTPGRGCGRWRPSRHRWPMSATKEAGAWSRLPRGLPIFTATPPNARRAMCRLWSGLTPASGAAASSTSTLPRPTNRSMQSMASKQQNLFRANSPVAFAEIQRDIYFDAVNAMFTGSTILLNVGTDRPRRREAAARAGTGPRAALTG